MSEADKTEKDEISYADRIEEIQQQIKDALVKHGGEHLLQQEDQAKVEEADLWRPVRQLELEDLKGLRAGDVVWCRLFEFGKVRLDEPVVVLTNTLDRDGFLEFEGKNRGSYAPAKTWSPELTCFSAQGFEMVFYSARKKEKE